MPLGVTSKFVPVSPFTGQTNGTITFPDYGPDLDILNANLAYLNEFISTNWGPGASKIPLTPQSVSQATLLQLGIIADEIRASTAQQLKLITSVNDLAKALKVTNAALGNVVQLQTKAITTQQMAYANQVNHNKFLEQTTNNALVAAGKQPTVVNTEDVTKEFGANAKSIAEVKAQANAYAAGEQLITEAFSAGLTWTKDLIVQTETYQGIEKFFTETYGKAKALFTGFFANAKARETNQTTVQAGAGNKAFTPPVENE